jgi:hypothetical protein
MPNADLIRRSSAEKRRHSIPHGLHMFHGILSRLKVRNIMSTYSTEFFSGNQGPSLQSAQEVMPMILKLVCPKSILDLGCGVGTWLSAAKQLNITDFLGVDGDYVDRSMLHIPSAQFQSHDLTKPVNLGRKFDLAMSLEVAEHLDERCAKTFVTSLTQHAPVVLFSAAIPYQGGNSHVNEQWPDYWIDLFAQQEYVVIDCLRSQFWDNLKVQCWYAQNMFLFVAQDQLQLYPSILEAGKLSSKLPLRIVNPRLHEMNHHFMEPDNIGFMQAVGLFKSALKRRLRGASPQPYVPFSRNAKK